MESKMENPHTALEWRREGAGALSLSLVDCSVQFGSFTSDIGGGSLYVFSKASFKTYVINSAFQWTLQQHVNTLFN